MKIQGRALVSTSHFVYLVDLASGESAKIASGQGLYYGITWDSSNIYVVSSDFHPLFRKRTRPKIIVLDCMLKKIEEIRPQFRIKGGVHQAHFDPVSKSLWWMSSKDDASIIMQDGKWEKWQPISENLVQWHERLGDRAKKNFDQPDTDIHHLNSVWINDRKIYIVAHNWGPSEVYIYDQEKRELVERISMGKCTHNVWRESEELFVCCSTEGSVVNRSGETMCNVDGFIRGAAVTKEMRIFGISEKANRRNRAKTTGMIEILTIDWQSICRWHFEKAGQVLEIRLLSEMDLCHNGIDPPIDKAVLEQPVSEFNYV